MGLAHYRRREYARALVRCRGRPAASQRWRALGAHRSTYTGGWGTGTKSSRRSKTSQLDPRNADFLYDLGGDTFRFLRRYPEAMKRIAALTFTPDLSVARIGMGVAPLRGKVNWDTPRVARRHAIGRGIGGPGHAERAAGAAAAMGAEGGQFARLGEKHQDTHIRFAALPPADGAVRGVGVPSCAATARPARGRRSIQPASLLDSALVRLPDDWRVHAARGMALAGIGTIQEALREARWLEQSDVYRGDAFAGTLAAEDRARILAQSSEVHAALDEIERLLAGTGVRPRRPHAAARPRWDRSARIRGSRRSWPRCSR